MRRILVSGVFLSCAGVSLVLAAGSQRPARDRTLEATVTIDASRPASYKIPRTIFGTFLEPIGNAIYGGLWAELLQNPSFEDNLWNAGAIQKMLSDEPQLARASELGLPLPWEPLDAKQGNRYEPRWNDAANSYRSLFLMGLPERPVGVRQKVFLPVHRMLKYVGSLYAKYESGPREIEVSIRRRDHPEEVFAGSKIRLAGDDWKRYEFRLDLEAGKITPLEPADFVIAVGNKGRVLVDQASLMPADNVDGMDPEIVEMAKAMKTPLLRFGGNFTSAYHWRDGIGPRDKRVSMLNIAWGMAAYTTLGTDEFLRFGELIGARRQIAPKLGGGTPEKAAVWVQCAQENWGETKTARNARRDTGKPAGTRQGEDGVHGVAVLGAPGGRAALRQYGRRNLHRRVPEYAHARGGYRADRGYDGNYGVWRHLEEARRRVRRAIVLGLSNVFEREC